MPSTVRKTPPAIPPPPRIPPPPPRNSNQSRPVPFPRRRQVPEPVSITSSSKVYLNRSTNSLHRNGKKSNVLGACLGQDACIKSRKALLKTGEACLKTEDKDRKKGIGIDQEAYLRLSDVRKQRLIEDGGVWAGSRKAWLEAQEEWVSEEGCDSGCIGDETLYVNGSCDSGVISDSSSKSVRKRLVRGEAKLRRIEIREGFESQEVSLFIDIGHDPNHLYESLNSDDDFDSFDSDSEEESFTKVQHDSGVDMGQLPDPPNQSTQYSLTQLAAKAGKKIEKLRRNWSLTKSDITKSLSRINLMKASNANVEPRPKISIPLNNSRTDIDNDSDGNSVRNSLYASVDGNLSRNGDVDEEKEKRNSLGRKKNWLMFRRSTSMIENNPPTTPSSTFYITDVINVDAASNETETNSTRHMSTVDQRPVIQARRKSKSPAVRPQSPPPPTPDKKMVKKSSRGASWYAEVGLFKSHSIPPPIPTSLPPPKSPNTCWYAEIGLYQTTQELKSPNSSSAENSGCSLNVTEIIETSEKINNLNKRNSQLSNPGDYDNVEVSREYENDPICNLNNNPRPQSIEQHCTANNEQLYQFYNQAVIENACRSNSSSEDSDCDGYEEIGPNQKVSTLPRVHTHSEERKRSHYYNTRCLWCEIPEVKDSQILNVLSLNEKKLQEAKFEIISSEVSYLKSLLVLEGHFMKNLSRGDIMQPEEKNILFGEVYKMVECSERFLADLEKCWKENILLLGICDVILKHSKEHFQVYITYCENQVYLDHTLKKLKERKAFIEVLKQLESSPECQSLSLYSFLMLPMQRITRLPLLIDAMLKRLTPEHDDYKSCEQSLISLNQLVQECNEGARRVERTLETSRVLNQLEFPPTIPPLPSPGASPRYLVRSGELTQLISRGDDAKLTFGRKFAKLQIHLFLFEDVLVIGKKKGEDKYGVIHHCQRNFIELSDDNLTEIPFKEAQGKHLIFLTLLENHVQKTVEMFLMCNSETDKQRWYDAFSPRISTNPDETIYEIWDCPQVTAIHFYPTEQPDELNLVIGDVINVTKKMADGWYYGERIRDSQTGWFPGNYTNEIVNRHVRARNLKQRYRLLSLTGSYLNKK